MESITSPIFETKYFYENKREFKKGKSTWACKNFILAGSKKVDFSCDRDVSSNLKKHVERAHAKEFKSWKNNSNLPSRKKGRFDRSMALFGTPTRTAKMDSFIIKRPIYARNSQQQVHGLLLNFCYKSNKESCI